MQMTHCASQFYETTNQLVHKITIITNFMEVNEMTTQEFIDAIKGMTVLELNDLVKACEEEFGVSAAAGVVVAAAGAGADAGAEKDEIGRAHV